MDEREAIARLRRGDVSGLEVLVRVHQLRAVRTAYLITGDRELAEDVVQQSFIRAFERIGQLRNSGSFGSWFLRSVANDAVKAATRGGRLVSLDAAGMGKVIESRLQDPAPAPEELLEGIETREELWSALIQLSPPQRAVIVQRYYLGLTNVEMADQLSAPVGTVKWRLHAARRHLRHLLTKGLPS